MVNTLWTLRVLVTFAVEAEFAPWRKRHDFREKQFPMLGRGGSISLPTAQIGETTVSVFLTGMGWSAHNDRFRQVLDTWPAMCISSGLAGALKPALRPGDVVATRRVGELGTDHWVECDRPLVRAAVHHGAVFAEACVTSKRILASPSQKRAASSDGDIVDMESYHILTAASGKKVPGRLVVRAISDLADEHLPLDFAKVADSNGQLKFVELAKEIRRKPHRIPALLAFGRKSRQAAKSLADFLDRFIPALKDGTGQWSNEHFEQVKTA